jgi:tetratricopeptide (TPR) repeat protein
MPPLVLRSGRLVRRSLIVALVLFVAVPRPRSGIQEFPQKDPLREAKRLAWLNNWTEAAKVLKRSDFKPTDESAALFCRAVEIRGNIESTPLPGAVAEVASMLRSAAAQRDFELRLQLLAIKGDAEFQFNLPAAQRTWEEAKQLASSHSQSQWEARAEGELGSIAFLNGEIFTATKLVTEAFLKAELSGDVAAELRYCTDLGEGFAQYGRSADAIRFFNKALALAAYVPDLYFPFTAYLGKARLLAITGHADEGFRMLHAALDESRAKNLKVREARTLTVLGELSAAAGKREEAIATLTAAADVAHSGGLSLIEAEASSALASQLRDSGRIGAAEHYARRSVEAAERAGDLYHLPQLTAGIVLTFRS